MKISLKDRQHFFCKCTSYFDVSDGLLIRKECLKGRNYHFSKFIQANVFTTMHFNHDVIYFGCIFILCNQNRINISASNHGYTSHRHSVK